MIGDGLLADAGRRNIHNIWEFRYFYLGKTIRLHDLKEPMEKSFASREQQVLIQLLRTARKSKGVTQVQLAARLAEAQSFVSDCERGQRRLDMVEVWRWCQALGISFVGIADAFEERAKHQGGSKGEGFGG